MPRNRLHFDVLEDRLTPSATKLFAGLEFMTTGSLATDNHVVTSSDPVQVGVAPAKNGAFTPLLQLDNGITFTDNDPAGTFTTTGTVSGLAGGMTLQLLDAQKHTFTAPGLLGTSYFTLAKSDSNAPHLEVGGGTLLVTALHLTASELDLQGTLTEADFPSVTFPFQGQSHAVLNASGVSVGGPDPTVVGPEVFTKDGLTFTLQNLDCHTDPVNNASDISGTASITIGGNTLTLTLGNTTTPGLVFANGDLQSLLATVTPPKGNADTPFTIGKLNIALNSATFSFDRAAGTFGIGADATFSVDEKSVEIKIGSANTPGIVIDSTGQLVSLDGSITTDLEIGGVTFKTEDLGVKYVPGSDLAVTGSASLEFAKQTIGLALGSMGADNMPHPGLDIDPSTGTVKSLDAAVSADIEIGGATIKADALGIHYAPGDDFTISGKAEFDLQDKKSSSPDQMLALQLGSDGHAGIDIDPNGNLVSFEAAVTSDITIAGLEIKTDGLGVEWQKASGDLAIFGGASFAVEGQSIGITLGSIDAPGLVINNGQLTSLTATVNADISLLGITLTANGLTVAYAAPANGNPEMISIYGDVAVKTSFLNFDSMLGTSATDPGIEIVGGQLQMLNITVNGGFSLFGFNIAAEGLTINYNAAQTSMEPANTLELSGGVMVQFTDVIQLGAQIKQGGLIINTQTGALSLDTVHGLEIQGSVTFGSYGIKNLDIAFSNGPNGVNFHANGELDLPDNIKVVLDKLDIVNGQLADIGITLDAPIEIGDTGFFIDSISGELDNLNNISQLKIKASVEVSEGPKIQVPSIPGIFSGGSFSLIDATGTITISTSEFDLSGQVTLLGGLLGAGSASISINWVTGVYMVSGNFSMYDGIITFGGSLTLDNFGDLTLLATASVNVPAIIPFIGGTTLGNVNFYLQYRPSHDANVATDLTQSYVAAWTNINLFFTSFTFGFKIDFTGNFSIINGNDVNAIVAQADVNQQQMQDAPATVYSCAYNIADPNAAGAQITLSTLDFFATGYNTGSYFETVLGSTGEAANSTTAFTYYQLSHSYPIESTLGFDVINSFGTNVGHVSFDRTGNFIFTTTGKSGLVPVGATVTTSGLVTVLWHGDPGAATAITNVGYSVNAHYNSVSGLYVPNAVIEVLQNTTSGTPELVDSYTIDPMGQGPVAASPGGAVYSDYVNNPALSQRGVTWSTTYTLPHGDPDWATLSFSVANGGSKIGTCTVDPQTGSVHFTASGSPALVPTGGIVHDNVIVLSWSSNPGSATSVTAMYRSLNDRVLNIDFNKDVAGDGTGLRGQYTVEVLAYQPLLNAPMFTETTHYRAPVVSFPLGQPYVKNGALSGRINVGSYVPGAAQGGVQGSATDTKVYLYYTQTPPTPNTPLNGTLFQTLDYGSFLNNGPNSLATGGFTWSGFQNLKVGQYYIYAVVNDGQNPSAYSTVTGPFTSTGPTPVWSVPAGLALSPNQAGVAEGTFSNMAGTALVVSMGFTTPVTIDAQVTGGTLVFAPGSMATQFPFTYPSAAAATADLNGLQFIADNTFNNATTLTLTATTNLNDTSFTATQVIPLVTANSHLVVTQSLYGPLNTVTVTNGGSGYESVPTVTFTSSDGLGAGATATATIQNGQITGVTITNAGTGYDAPPIVTFVGGNPTTAATATATVLTPTDPDTSILTVTVSNPGGPNDQAGTNVMIQQYLTPGLTIASFTTSQGMFNPTTKLWNIGNLPISTNAVTLTLTLKADPSTYDQQLASMADGNSDLFNYPAGDAANVLAIIPRAHDVVFPALTLPATAIGAPFGWQFTADRGGGGPYKYTLAAGSTAPPGLFLDSSGSLSGLPTTAGNYIFAVTATSPSGATATATMQLAIAGAPIAVAGTAYSLTLGTANYQYFTVTPGATLPAGLSINYDVNSGNYVLNGTPTTPGFYSFSVRANSVFFGLFTDMPITLFVDTPIVIGPATLPNAAVGSPYSQSLSATGGDALLLYGLSGGREPLGLTINLDGTITGTVASSVMPGIYNFTVYAYDASGSYGLKSYSLLVEPALVVNPPMLPAATVNSPYSVSLAATGGSGNGYTLAVTGGTLPPGLSLTPAGVLSGTIPAGTLAIDTPVTITATDSNGTSVSRVFTIPVNPALAITPTDLGDTAAGTDFTTALTAIGGSDTGYTFALVGGSLPAGLSLAADGSITGNVDPHAPAGYYAIMVTVTDADAATATATCMLFVDAAPTVAIPKLPDAMVGSPYSQHFTASGGSGIFSYAVTAGSLPAGLTLSPAGVLSGTVPGTTPAGAYSFTVTATDSLGNIASVDAMLTVDPANVTWTGAASSAWSNPANWSPRSVPGAGDNVTIPAVGRLPVLDTSATVYNLTLQSGATLTLAGHGLSVYGNVTNKGTVIPQGNENVSLAHGNDTTEGTWRFVGDGTGGTLTIPDFGAADFFNLTINDNHTHVDTFKTAAGLNLNGNLTITCGTFAPGSTVTTCGVSLSGTGVLDAPALLNDSGNWTVTGGTFNPDGGTVALTGSGTSVLTSGGKAFANLTHTGTGTLGLAGNNLTVNGSFTDAAGSGNFRTNSLAVTIGGPTALAGGSFTAGTAPIHFNGGLALSGGSFLGSTGAVTAVGVAETAGNLVAPTSALTDTGDWTITGGTFNANHGTVILAGANQYISGNTAFFNLTKTAPTPDTLTFQVGSTQTIGGTLTLKGAAGKLLALRSSTPGSTWSILPSSTVTAAFIDVMDSMNLGKKTINATTSHNSGDNSGWHFA